MRNILGWMLGNIWKCASAHKQKQTLRRILSVTGVLSLLLVHRATLGTRYDSTLKCRETTLFTRMPLLGGTFIGKCKGPPRGGGGCNNGDVDNEDVAKTGDVSMNGTNTTKCSDNMDAFRDTSTKDSTKFTVLSETLIYEKWRRLISRQVQLPSGLIANFEIVGQKRSLGVARSSSNDTNHIDDFVDQAVLIFVWNRSTKTTTLIREYMPSVHRKMFGLAAGMVEADKHNLSSWNGRLLNAGRTIPPTDRPTSIQEIAAWFELEEECQLCDGVWIQLTTQPVTMDKYSMTGLTVFLVLDPISVKFDSDSTNQMNLQRDSTEEGMEIVSNVTLKQLDQLIRNSELTAIGSWACLLAIHHLRIMGEV
jgi:hypothetical protein